MAAELNRSSESARTNEPGRAAEPGRPSESGRMAILDRVQKSLDLARREHRIPALPPAGAAPNPPAIPEEVVRQLSAAPTMELWDFFSRRLELLGDQTILAAGAAEARLLLASQIKGMGLKHGVACPDALELLSLAPGESKEPHNPPEKMIDSLGGAAIEIAGNRESAFQADFGITLCLAGVAETGTIVLPAGAGRSRLASLAPPVHFALLPLERMAPDLWDIHRTPGAEGESYTVWVTGSSRTADIEGILIRGVHGPGKLIVLGIQKSESPAK